jgi:methionine sulfoxide reductase catalytic subunit
MLIRKASDIPASEITPEAVYIDRRRFLGRAAGIGLAGALALAGCDAADAGASNAGAVATGRAGDGAGEEGPEEGPEAGPGDEVTEERRVTEYNNFYEFGTDKSEPAENAKHFRTRPWTVAVEGLVAKPAVYQIEDFVRPSKVEERVYRFRCVEAWSAVIPWLGFPLADVLRRAQPLGSARYVELTTLHDPAQMPGQRRAVLDWPYTEGLRLDEAMHPLAILSTGMYGKTLPNQNGAPLRLVVPWKYGFKSIKSVVKLRVTERQPETAWNKANPDEYGFYSNVNPEVDHPRWSQAKERRLGEFRKRPTLPFNGYAAEVGRLYAGMDLRKNY